MNLVRRAAQQLGFLSSEKPPLAQPDPIPVIAANLEALRLEADNISYRKLAAKLGDMDHKAVSAHCHGKRKPEDRTLALYAGKFSELLNRKITVDDIKRKADA